MHVPRWVDETPIAWRLTLLFALGSWLVMCGIGLHLYDVLGEQLAERDREELRGKVELVRNLLASSESVKAIPLEAKRWMDAFVGHHGLTLNLFDNDYRLLLRTTDDRIRPATFERFIPQDDTVRTADRLVDEHGAAMQLAVAWGYAGGRPDEKVLMVLALDRTEDTKLLAHHLQHVLVAIVAGSLVSAVLGFILSYYGLRPVHLIARETSRIGPSGLDRRLDVGNAPPELKTIAVAFNRVLERLQDSFQRLSDFSSDLAHELRTPINNLLGQSQVALSKKRDENELREVLVSNIEEYERLARMIDDILFLARADNAQETLQRESFDVGAEAQRIVSFFELLAEERGVRLSASGQGTLHADREMVQRAIANLVSNALRHTPSGGCTQVTIDAREDGSVAIHVSNDGAPIPPEHVGKIFDRFYRADPSREGSREGAGLGLSIVKSIMTLHRGTASVTSGPGQKTTFTLEFPAN